MIKSMTGYGRSEVVVGDRHFIVEMKSVNNRFLDFNIRMPQVFNPFESQIRAELKKFMERGKVDIYISYRNLSESRVHVRYDKALASEYVRELREMASDFGLDGSISISLLAGYPDIFVLESAEEDPSLLWEPLAKALDQACEQFVAAREKEGAFLKEDLTGKLQDMLSRVDYLTGRAPEILTEYRTQLLEKMQELLSESGINEERILQEAAIYADRTCIDEELTRLRSHITAMQDTFALTGSIGKKLDFLAQEMGRESNTILSKTADVASKECAIDLKTEVEKVREQVQNIE